MLLSKFIGCILDEGQFDKRVGKFVSARGEEICGTVHRDQ